MSLMDNNNNRLFIHRNMEHVTLEHNVEIILTPQFYTFMREELEIKFSYQAKQIAASLFDDYIDNTIEHQYHVNKCNNNWCFYAYDIEEIEAFLESVGIEKHRVSKIYFAQELHAHLEEPFLLSEQNILQTIDDTVVLIPSRLMEPNISFSSLNLEKIKLTSGVSLAASHSSFISLKETVILSSIFCIFAIVFIIEGNRIKSSINHENQKLSLLIDENPRYDSGLVRSSILEQYQPIDKRERAKRQSIKDISKLLSAKSQLDSLSIKKSTIQATIHILEIKISKQVLQSAKAKKFKSSLSGGNVKVEKKI